MYAAIITLSIDPTQAPAAAAAFTKNILPRIRSAPGVVAGHWVDPEDGRGLGFIVFDTEENARQATPPAVRWEAPGVTIQSVEIRRVAVSI